MPLYILCFYVQCFEDAVSVKLGYIDYQFEFIYI